MDNENINQDTLRETIEKNFDAIESQQSLQDEGSNQEQAPASDRARDERGRFAPKTESAAPEAEAPISEPEVIRPKGWKKDYWAAYDKLNNGQPLTPEESKALASYALQRENEFASGVSTYKSEAEQAKAWNEAVKPMVGRLQQLGIQPTEYISQLVQVDSVLTSGSPQQKIQLLGQLAKSYGIPLSVFAQSENGVDGHTSELLAMQQRLSNEISQIKAWRDSQETATIQSTIDGFKNSGKAPHFEAVREQMGRLLDAGMASTLEEAYEAAVLLNPDTRLSYLSTHQEANSKLAAAEKARSAAVSVKTSAPKGKVATGGNANDLRSVIEASWDSMMT